MKLTMNTIKGTGDFSNSFWRFIREDIGIHIIYPEGKKKQSFEERQKKVEQLLEKVDFNDDKLTPGEALLGKWYFTNFLKYFIGQMRLSIYIS